MTPAADRTLFAAFLRIAASAGLRVGDQLGAVNGHPIRRHAELGRFVSVLPPRTVLRFSVRRGSRVVEVAVTLGDPPAPAPVRSTTGGRGGGVGGGIEVITGEP